MWREIRLLAASKPVIASMADVAASGGYYMAMGAEAIVAESLTLTGSIGVVTGESGCFNVSVREERRACRHDNLTEIKNIDLLKIFMQMMEYLKDLFSSESMLLTI